MRRKAALFSGTNFPPIYLKEKVAMSAEKRLKELGITLPTPPKPVAKYKPTVLIGNCLYCLRPRSRQERRPGRVAPASSASSSPPEQAARNRPALVGINILATVKASLGSLDRVKRLVKTLGMVNAAPDFLDHPQVINGFSELMAQVFGDDAGVGARSAVGMGSLPGDIPVEVEFIFEVQ